LSAILLSNLSSAYTLFMMGGFKKPRPKAAVKCEDCGRSFVNERALGQHLNSKAHASMISHDEDTLPIVCSAPVAFDTPSSQSLAPRPIDFDDEPKEVELPRKDDATSSVAQFYEIRSIEGKGKGLVALKDIEIGERILCEPPLLTTAHISSASQLESTIGSMLKCLSEAQQREFLSLYNNHSKKGPFSGIIKTNALPLGPGSTVGGIFPIISRINHSCHPNTQHTWNRSTEHETIHAIRNIKKGEEITISYTLGGPSQPRRQSLKDKFGFDCTCDLCSLRGEARKISDYHQELIKSLDYAIGYSDSVTERPESVLAYCRELLSLYEMEAITDPRVARVYFDAFQICVKHSDQARASVFAQKAYETRLYLEGEDSPDTQRMKFFMVNPAGHMAFGLSQRWKQLKEEVPKNVDTQEFDQWLWLPADSTDNDNDASSFDSSDSDAIFELMSFF
jgi:SET domain